MPGQLIAVPGTNTIYAMFQMTIFQEDLTDLWTPFWAWQDRSRATYESQWWTHTGGWWPSMSGFYSDPASSPPYLFGQSGWDFATGSWSPWLASFGGTKASKVIMGQCLDSASAAVSGAVVQLFLTSNDTLVAEVTADSNGRYTAPTPYPATNHYIVAYRAGSPDITGASVNTLQGTDADGA